MVTSRAYLDNARTGAGLDAVRDEVARLMSGFINKGAQPVEPAALLPADTLIDLYGEDLRARAYTTHDPVEGELMLRPDFTVPVVQIHMQNGDKPARYAYAGSVWRKQEHGSNRPVEYLQSGFELLGEHDTAKADAEVFAIIATALADLPLQATTGDMGLIFAAIDALDTNERRKAALRRHVWRPTRFNKLLKRYSSQPEPGQSRSELLAAVRDGSIHNLIAKSGQHNGVRSVDEIIARAEILLAEVEAKPISRAEIDMINAVLAMKCTLGSAADELRKIAPLLGNAADNLEARAKALVQAGIDASALPFEAAYGQDALEYYDGFVFGFQALKRPDLPQIAQGGRYDALTKALGNGQSIPVVGGIIRPEALLALKGGAA